jgi:hypothetical protein
MQRAFIIQSLSMRDVMGSLSHRKPTPARNVESVISHAVQVTLFVRRTLNVYFPAFNLALQLLTFFYSC